MFESAERTIALLDDLLDLSRMDASRFELNIKEADLSFVVREAVATQAELARERVHRARERWPDHDFAVSEVERSVIASVDSGMVRSVIDQLLENVEQHTPIGTHGTVAVAMSDSEVTVTVVDDGPGLDEMAMTQLFDRFYRVDEARTRSTNMGLGLAVIAAIAHPTAAAPAP